LKTGGYVSFPEAIAEEDKDEEYKEEIAKRKAEGLVCMHVMNVLII
jgi:hypothetical protein